MPDINDTVRQDHVKRGRQQISMPPSVFLAFTALKEIVSADYPELLEHPEYNAILSHWLQSPNVRPPQLPDKLYADRNRIFRILATKL